MSSVQAVTRVLNGSRVTKNAPGREHSRPSASTSALQPVIELRHKISRGNAECRADDTQLQHGHFPMTRLDLGKHRLRHTEPGSQLSLVEPSLLPSSTQHRAQSSPIPPVDEMIEGTFPLAPKS